MKRGLSMAKAILAVLWQKGRADNRLLLNHKYINKICANKSSATCRSSLSRLVKKGMVQRGNGVFTLHEDSKTHALMAYIDAESNLHSHDASWDGGWRMIFFDIPESKRQYRDYLRKVIKQIGFKEFQKSTWVYPYPVPSFLKEILLHENIKGHTRLITTEAIENDGDLRAMFKLSSPKKAKLLNVLFKYGR